ncbi:MAG: ATP-dependent Clp protease ATP-binding subunit [Paludibacteraceae bacterium]|nr:ATP-dependent Clp protease ATP-binding subunit [Paludibacteraceae bacterium]
MIVTLNLNRIIVYAQEEAERLHSNKVEIAHFMLAILRLVECSAYDLLLRTSFRPEEGKAYFEQQLRSMAVESGTPQQRSNHADRILRIAEGISREYQADAVGSAHLLLAIMREQVNPVASYLEEAWGISFDQLVELYGQPHYSGEVPTNGNNQMGDLNEGPWQAEEPQQKGKKKKSGTSALDKYGRDLTKLAEDGQLDPVVGREVEIERVVQILSRRKKNNPILIGEPGVGKSAIVEGLALRINKEESGALHGKRIVTLDLASMVAGTTYRGQFEERMKNVLTELREHPEVILFIDEIHTIIGAGNASGSLDAANILKPALARGEVQCIGATTTAEYAKSIEKDGALERRFQKVPVRPTTGDETFNILTHLSEHYAHYHHVIYTREVLKACVGLSERYLTDRAFPDKAIDVMDEVGARSHARQQGEEDKTPAYTITTEDVAGVVSMMSGVPVQRVATAENERLRTMSEVLRRRIIGQDKAVETVVKAIQRSRLGLRDPKRPIGTFFFLGQTGVGKTYLAQCLAEEMFGSKDAIIRFDMSEYMEKHTVSLLVGAPPGYVAHEDGGKLTEAVRRNPYSIVLFDEIEKAHPDIFNILLQVLDEGRLTDRQGHNVDFRNTIIVLTSNVGTRQLQEFGNGVGFSAGTMDQKETNKMLLKALQKQFPPEFVNRIDNVVTFEPLSKETIGQIVKIEISMLQQRLKTQGHQLNVTPEVIGELVEKSFDTKNGARPVKRAVQTYLEDPLTEILLRKPNQKRITIKQIKQQV